MTNPELFVTTEASKLSDFWREIALTSGDPFAHAMSEFSQRADVLPIKRDSAIVVRIDEQPAFMQGGGLPLEHGEMVANLSRKLLGEGGLASIDTHGWDNIGNATAHNLPPFSFLFLENEVVKVALPNAEQTVIDYQTWPDGVHTAESVAHYLKRQKASRLLTALFLHCDISGLGQVLWPNHANDLTTEKILVKPDQKIIIKGADNQTDSYSAFIEGNGTPVLVDDLSSVALLDQQLTTKDLSSVVFTGLAGNYCVLYSAESARLAQEIQKITQNKAKIDWEDILLQLIQQRGDLEVSKQQVAIMIEMLETYSRVGFTLQPEVHICVALDHTDVVRGPGGIGDQADVEKLLQRYKQLGIKLVTL